MNDDGHPSSRRKLVMVGRFQAAYVHMQPRKASLDRRCSSAMQVTNCTSSMTTDKNKCSTLHTLNHKHSPSTHLQHTNRRQAGLALAALCVQQLRGLEHTQQAVHAVALGLPRLRVLCCVCCDVVQLLLCCLLAGIQQRGQVVLGGGQLLLKGRDLWCRGAGVSRA